MAVVGERAESESSAMASVTVVIPAFNAQAFIETSLRSAIRERPARVVVLDDGSTDSTAELAREISRAAATDTAGVQVDIETIHHGGEAAARNAGLYAAKTEWVAFLDADDRFLPGRLAKLLAMIEADPGLDAVTSDAYMEVDGEIRGRCYSPAYEFAHTDQAQAILRQNFVFGHVLARRQRLIDLGGFDESISHTTDWAMWIDLVLSGGRIGCVPEPLSVYRVHAQSASANQMRMTQGMVASLQRAQGNVHLTPELETVLGASLASAEQVVDAQRLDAALESGVGVRPAASIIINDRRQPLRRRIKAFAAKTSPKVMTTWKRFRQRGKVIGTAGWLIPDASKTNSSTYGDASLPLVSVVIAFLDEKRFLADAIATVRAQTMSDWELLLVDDGSTDGSGRIADDVAAEAPGRIRVLRHPDGRNEGLAASRNLGLRHASAGTVAFLDADDRWQPDKLDVQLQALAENPDAGMVAGETRHRFLDQDRADEIHPVGRFGATVLPTARFARELLRERIAMPPPPSSVLYRTATLTEAGGVPAGNSTYEDQRTFVVTSLLAPTVILDREVTTYARRSDSLYGRLGDDNVTKSHERRQFEWWALRTLGRLATRYPRAIALAGSLITHRLRVAVSRRFARSASRQPASNQPAQERTAL